MSKNLYMFHFNECFTKYLCQTGKNFAAFFEKNLPAAKKRADRISSLSFVCHISRFLLLAASTRYGRHSRTSDR
ncbi:hypothetical protein B1690_11590 [Geobacillus sp. 46C-IIa]|nr:hypothetical protein B1690_11590 [Geobacillus sp. 46C-IIa]